jgi:hypothetical protein
VAHTAAAAADAYTTALPDLGTAGLATAAPIAIKVGRTAEEVAAKRTATVLENSATGARREAQVATQLAAENPGKVVQGQRLLRDATGTKVIDPVTGTGRRVDHAVIDRSANTAKTYETTGPSVRKELQIQKEDRIRSQGGTFIRDRETRKVVPTQGTSEVIRKL